MKVEIESLSWDYVTAESIGNDEPDRICTATRIEATLTYPATEKTCSVTFRGTVRHLDRICDVKEARRIVENIAMGGSLK